MAPDCPIVIFHVHSTASLAAKSVTLGFMPVPQTTASNWKTVTFAIEPTAGNP
jgi:hypothetical protein